MKTRTRLAPCVGFQKGAAGTITMPYHVLFYSYVDVVVVVVVIES